MKKSFVTLLVFICIAASLCGCGPKQSIEMNADPDIEFNISENQLQSICRLATLKCFFNNVAETTLKGSFLQKDSKLWIEYSSTVDMGVDFSKVRLEENGNTLIIYMPEAEIVNVNDPVIGENSYYMSQQGLFSAKLNAEDEQTAFTKAQENMRQTASESKALLQAAKMRAQVLVENYIHQMDELAGTSHKIVWRTAD